jgi:hypothetical protein
MFDAVLYLLFPLHVQMGGVVISISTEATQKSVPLVIQFVIYKSHPSALQI